MANPKNVDLTEDKLFFLGTGLLHRCVCAPSSWSADEVADKVTAQDPPGTSANRWVISDPTEREGAFNGVSHERCPDDMNRTHWLLNC